MIRRWMALEPRLRFATIAACLIALAIIAPVAWYLGSPLFINQVVDEDFPAGDLSSKSQPTIAMMAEATVTPTRVQAAMASSPAISATPTQNLSATQGVVITITPTSIAVVVNTVTMLPATPIPLPSATVTQIPPTFTPIPSPTAIPVPTATPIPSGPVIVAIGRFDVIDTIHGAEGTATIFRLPTGQRILRFENFRSTNGPDLFVYLSGHPSPRTSAQVHQGAAFEVARLKGNVGNQNYELPDNLDILQFKSVVIYCKQFTTVFSTAELAPGS